MIFITYFTIQTLSKFILFHIQEQICCYQVTQIKTRIQWNRLNAPHLRFNEVFINETGKMRINQFKKCQWCRFLTQAQKEKTTCCLRKIRSNSDKRSNVWQAHCVGAKKMTHNAAISRALPISSNVN